MKELMKQLFRFGIVGVCCTVVDYLLMLGLVHIGFHYLLACAIAFLCATVLNYILSMRFVFSSEQSEKKKEFVIFFVLSVSGLLLTEILMHLLSGVGNMDFKLSKILTIGIVMCYNFVSRKLIFERRKKADSV